jgi:hypothetical protein
MTPTRAFGTFMNLVFTIAIWFAIPIVMPVAAALAWVLIVLNFFFSLGIAIMIPAYYKQETK